MISDLPYPGIQDGKRGLLLDLMRELHRGLSTVQGGVEFIQARLTENDEGVIDVPPIKFGSVSRSLHNGLLQVFHYDIRHGHRHGAPMGQPAT